MHSVWQKPGYDYIILNESTPQDYCYKHEPHPEGKGGGVASIYNNGFCISQRVGFKYSSLVWSNGASYNVILRNKC